MIKPKVYGAEITTYAGENVNKMVKTYAELRIQSFFHLRACFMRYPGSFLHLNPCGYSWTMSKALRSIFSLMHSDSEGGLEKRLFLKLILCLTLQEVLLHHMHKIESTGLKRHSNDEVLFPWFG